MSRTSSAVPLDTAASQQGQIAPAVEAHDTLQSADAVEVQTSPPTALPAQNEASSSAAAPTSSSSSLLQNALPPPSPVVGTLNPSLIHSQDSSEVAIVAGAQDAASRVTPPSPAPDPIPLNADALRAGVSKQDIHDPVAPPHPNPIVPPSPRDATPPPPAPISPSTSTTTHPLTAAAATLIATRDEFHKVATNLESQSQELGDNSPSTHDNKMIFGHPSPAKVLHRKRNYANTNAVTDYEADLTSKDRAKQKEAVKKYLMERVREDWTWDWPRPIPGSDESSPERAPEQLDEAILEGPWKERDEWLSNASESDGEPAIPGTTSSPDTPSPTSRSGPFRFESPDGVGTSIKRAQLERKRRRRKRLTEELKYNDGMRCFVARRDAWTGARQVPKSALGLESLKKSMSASRASDDGGSSTAIEPDDDDEWEDEIEVPIAPPLIPAENAMRASILPAAYNTIYDKVVVQALTPSCPMNLKDVTRSCVQGWKRDGEWPPKATAPEPKKKGRKMSIASLFGVEKHEKEVKDAAKGVDKEKEQEKKAGAGSFRKGIQKIFNLGHGPREHAHTNGDEGKSKDGEAAHIS